MEKAFLKDFGAFVDRQKEEGAEPPIIKKPIPERKIRYKPHFLFIPYDVYNAPNVTKTDALVYAVIYWFSKMELGRCIASNDYIASVLGVKKSTIINSLKRLEDSGCIERIFEDWSKRKRLEIIPLVDPKLEY